MAKAIESRAVARLAVAGLAVGLVALAGLALWGSVSMQRATARVEALNEVTDAWSQVFQHVNLEDEAMRDYARTGTDIGRQPLASAAGQAEENLAWLRGHGSPDNVAAAARVSRTYGDYTATLREMIALGDQGDVAASAAQADQAALASAALRKQISGILQRRRLETAVYLREANTLNQRLRLGAIGAFAVDGALLGLCSMVLLAHQRRIRRQAARSLHDALHDSLTGLANRALLADRIAQSVRESDRYEDMPGLLLIDLDRFKEVNDTLGHHSGDLLLQEVARRLRLAVRDVDTVARLGGDEFAVLLPRVGSPENALMVADRVLEAFATPVDLDGVLADVGGSIGVAVYPRDASGPDELLKHADIAMYAAKRGRLGIVAYEPDLRSEPAPLRIVTELRRAIDEGELVLHYQPKARADNGEICGVEALARWQHPERGLLGPMEFIPAAEESGLIEPLTRYVLDVALAQCRGWIAAGTPVPISVNVGVRCLHNEEFPGQVAELLAAHRVPADMLTLEITETAIITDPPRAAAVLRRLEDLGVRLSIDDFGTGYSSIAYLRSMRVHEMKLDRDFVTRMRADSGRNAIVRSLLDLGRNFDLQVVAEGVEDPETWSALEELGCHVIQGYYLSKPLPADELTGWLGRHRAREALAA